MKKSAEIRRVSGQKLGGLFRWVLTLCISGFFTFVLAAEDPLTIHLWHQRPAPSRAVLHDLINQYEQENPGVEIQLLYKENEELRMGYQAAAAFTGGGPEILYGPSDFTGALDEMQIVKPLETLFDSTFLSDFDPNGLTRYNGHLYQIGDELGNHLALVWNKRLFREVGLDRAPRTLDELIEFGQKLTLDIDGDGVTDQYGLVWNYTEPFFFV
ncbi:MAG: extracellular solute-binding protein, partial [Candidatus Marinimicrobia bacterium]|nr:extracellular solute-binding protein [Candidatus Neomarinimicrobiota bacterium]